MKTAKRLFGLFLIVSLCCSLLSGCATSVGGDSFGFSLSAEPRQIDPQVAEDAASLAVIEAVFEGLVRLDENGEVQEGAATVSVSADRKTYTFHLKDSYWSVIKVRGTETGFEQPIRVTAHDFVFGIRRAADPTTASPHAVALRGIVNVEAVQAGTQPPSALGVKAVDDETLVITLSAPDEQFLERLAGPAFMPCHQPFFEYTGGRYGLEPQFILSNGAFYVSAWEHGKSVSLKKNTQYHGAADILPISVKYRVTQSAEEDFELLKEGNLDAALIPKALVEDAKSTGLNLVELADTVQYLWMNQAVPILQNQKIRNAFAAAIEWDAVRENLPSGYTFSNSFTAPAATDAVPAERIKAYATDAAAARSLWQAGLSELDLQKVPTLTLLAAEDAESANLARYILQSFSKNLSFQIRLELVDEKTLAARVQAGNYELAIFAVTGKGASAKENLEIFTAAASSGNYARFADGNFDELYASVGDDAAAVERLSAYLYDKAPVLPLGYYTRYYGVRKNCEDVLIRPFNGGGYGATVSFNRAKITT